jgi:CBS domain-containing protein
MSTHPFSVHPTTPVAHAAQILATNMVGSLPVVENGNLVGIITGSDMLHALEAILGKADDCVRIDLDVAGSGEITAAISLARTICPVLAIGTYKQKASESETLYLRVAATGARRAADTLREYGFKVRAVHKETDWRLTVDGRPSSCAEELTGTSGKRVVEKLPWERAAVRRTGVRTYSPSSSRSPGDPS